jgi:hypothetical protein
MEALCRGLREFKLATADCDSPEQARWLHHAIAEAPGGAMAFESAVGGLAQALGPGESATEKSKAAGHRAANSSDGKAAAVATSTAIAAAAKDCDDYWDENYEVEGANDEYGLPRVSQRSGRRAGRRGVRLSPAPRITPVGGSGSVSVEQQRQRNKHYNRVMLS